jgi:hypothetical protein
MKALPSGVMAEGGTGRAWVGQWRAKPARLEQQSHVLGLDGMWRLLGRDYFVHIPVSVEVGPPPLTAVNVTSDQDFEYRYDNHLLDDGSRRSFGRT